MPPIFDIALPLDINGSVHITAVGTPIFSRVIPSCTLHDEHEPQSPDAVITTSHCSTSSLNISSGQGRDAFPLFRLMVALNSYRSDSMSWTISNNSSALSLLLQSRPTTVPSRLFGLGDTTALAGMGSTVGSRT